MIHGTKTNVNKIQIQPVNNNTTYLNNNSINSNTMGNSSFMSNSGMGSSKGVMGFDYRGSINIKKHIVNKDN